ncbi:hypothetical protein PHYBOEH_006102 [Phytophthora boehmeriae]|uniref:Uncharacterized protein n=1 Tax=Phytophthora boehmeriae TaxID=109152 RepID=A0A8T1X321_9STRA|nr:hypothetical protein PHYBOEH_006102 [Phytophthora boehmeriae]
MKRLHALGTSSSAPVLPASTLGNVSDNVGGSGQGQGLGSTVGVVNPVPTSASGIAGAGTIPAGGTTAIPAPVSDADKLRNDFNSQATRLSYGCSVALELFNGHLMMVGSPDGQVRVQSLEKLQTPQIKGYKDRAIFTMLDLVDVRSAGSIRYGDSVWLQLSVGPGDVTWEQGGVLGAKVREAPQLKALGLMDDDAIRNNVQAPAIVGYPVPVTAYLPKSRDEADLQVDEIQSRLRNKSAKMLGKWTIRSAVYQRRKQKDNFVYNNDEVYLEQDWFYLGADSDAGIAVLRQLPPAVVGKDVKPGEYVVERRGAWKMRLLDSSSGSAGLSLAQQQMERLLLRAKSQIKQSQRMRAGQTKVYGPNLRGGSGFTVQLRAQVAASTRQTESRYADRQENRLKRIDRHMSDKAQRMNVDIGFEDKSARREIKSSSRRRTNANDGVMSSEGNEITASSSAKQEEIDLKPHSQGSKRPPATSSQSAAVTNPGKTLAKPGTADGSPPESSSNSPNRSDNGSSCALCHSSSIGYNLCCQFRSVMQKLEQERLAGNVGASEKSLQSDRDPSTAVTSRSRKTLPTRAGHITKSEYSSAASTSTFSQDGLESRQSKDTRHDASAEGGSSTFMPGPHSYVEPLNERVMQLFAKEDATMIGIIKYKENEVYQAMAAEAQERIGISPAAAHFRDRFKHVNVLMQMHKKHQEAQQDGISGHFQKLRADLYSNNNIESANDDDDDSEDDYSDSDESVDQALLPQQNTDSLSQELTKSEEKAPPDPDRLFPTSKELRMLTPVDTKAALALYVQNRTAMAEMMDGYAELVDSHITPALKSALSSRNRAASNVGDFVSFQKEFDDVITELQGATNFIRFFRQKRAARKTKAK